LSLYSAEIFRVHSLLILYFGCDDNSPKEIGNVRLGRIIFGNSDFSEDIVVYLLIFSTFLYPADILDIT
jgi:hypothetical protein